MTRLRVTRELSIEERASEEWTLNLAVMAGGIRPSTPPFSLVNIPKKSPTESPSEKSSIGLRYPFKIVVSVLMN